MKRLGTIVLMGLLTNAMLAASALAAVNYIQYNQEFRAEKESSAGSGEKFMHRSKYQREETTTGNTLQTQDRNLNKPAGKYGQPEAAPSK